MSRPNLQIGVHVSEVIHKRFGRTILELGGNNSTIGMRVVGVFPFLFGLLGLYVCAHAPPPPPSSTLHPHTSFQRPEGYPSPLRGAHLRGCFVSLLVAQSCLMRT
jgi:hypothetical protein